MNDSIIKKRDDLFSVCFIRNSWISIFSQVYDYTYLSFSSLIPPIEDKSLLFVNSGVVTLKKKFRENDGVVGFNAVNCQPVVRTDDIRQISSSSFHQTMFEMLGSFSISGNFKAEVIPIVWEWLTSSKWLSISKERLFITVWREDKESYKIWRSLSILPKNIFLGEKKTNFWDMGNGPCGPNTEIYYSLEEKIFPNSLKQLNSKRFVELGNIVFPEFDHQENEYRMLKKMRGRGNGFRKNSYD